MENGQSVFLSPHTVRLARFARARLLRHALPISLLLLRKKPTVLQSTKYNDILETVQDDDLAKVGNIWEQVCGEWSDFERDVRDEIKYLEQTVLESNSVISLRVQREVKQPKVSSQNHVQTVYFQLK